MMPYHKFPEDKVMLSRASWEKTAAGRRYDPLNYPLKMPRQKKLKAQLEIPFHSGPPSVVRGISGAVGRERN